MNGNVRADPSLIEEQDGAAAEVHHLEISDAKLHYHERSDEIYYVLAGAGRMRLDDEEIELNPMSASMCRVV